MAETVQGGAYLLSDGRTWVNANGERIDAPARKDRRAHDEAQAEAERLTQAQQEAAQQSADVPAVRRTRG